MVSIDTQKVQMALADFLDQRVLTALDQTSPYRWILGGASTIALSRVENLIKTYSPLLKSLGVLDETGNIILNVVETFVTSAFQKQSSVKLPILGIPFTFTKDDGEALITLLKQYGEL